jgi:hypothetical protein
MLARILAITALLMAFGTAVAGAAPTLTADHPSYAVGRDVMTISGSGFTPSGRVDVWLTRLGGDPGGFTLTAGPTGTFVARTKVPALDWFGLSAWEAMPMPVTANDTALQTANPALPPDQTTASVMPTFTDWGVRVTDWVDGTGRPRHMTTIMAMGWANEGKTIWAHYTRNGKLVKTVRVGALTGIAGNVTRHMREFPFRPVPQGTYRVQFDTSQRYRVPGEWYTVYKFVRVAANDAVR